MNGPFSFLSSFGPLSVISSHSGLEMLMIYPKKIPGANPYTCLFELCYLLLLLWFDFGSVRGGFFFIFFTLFPILTGLVQIFFSNFFYLFHLTLSIYLLAC
jgi:hypothetical protein